MSQTDYLMWGIAGIMSLSTIASIGSEYIRGYRIKKMLERNETEWIESRNRFDDAINNLEKAIDKL